MKKLHVLLSFLAIAGFASTSFAGWGSSGGYGSSGGGYGSTGASYGSSGAAYGSSGGGYGSGGSAVYAPSHGSSGGVAHVGPLRRLAARIHSHHANRVVSYGASSGGGSSGYSGASYGSSGGYSSVSYGSSGGHGSSGGSYGRVSSYGSSGGVSYGGSSGGYSHGGHGSSGGSHYAPSYSSAPSYGSSGSSYSSGMIYEGAPMSSDTIMESAPMNHGTSMGSSSDSVLLTSAKVSALNDEIHLVIDLPESARVFVNGNATTSKGTSRRFVSRNLEAGASYRFEVRVEDERDGKVVTENKTLVLVPGTTETLAFKLNEKPVVAETVLKLNVPADAKVSLAGNTTSSKGESRTYRTKELTSGQVWEDYTVVVSWNGIVREKSIRLIGGDEMELSFNFDAVASN